MATRSPSVRRDDLYQNLSLDKPQAGDPFADGPAVPAPVRQATHPALQAARAAATANQGMRPAQGPYSGEPAMPSAASGANGTTSPSAYAQQFQQAPTGFSDAPRQQRHSKKPSLFRRSVVALTGSRMSQSHARPPSTAGAGGLQRKPSALRKSMAWLLGPPPPVRLAPGIGDTPSIGSEKTGPGSKDPYLGGGGEGNEWDVDGSGAAFWKRFSVAQRRAQNSADPLTMQSKEFVSGQKSANRKMRIGVYIFLALVVALIIGLAVGIPAAHKHSSSDSDSGGTTNSKRAMLELPTDLPAPAEASHAAAAAILSAGWSKVAAEGQAQASAIKRTSSQGRTHQKLAHRRAVKAGSNVLAQA